MLTVNHTFHSDRYHTDLNVSLSPEGVLHSEILMLGSTKLSHRYTNFVNLMAFAKYVSAEPTKASTLYL